MRLKLQMEKPACVGAIDLLFIFGFSFNFMGVGYFGLFHFYWSLWDVGVAVGVCGARLVVVISFTWNLCVS